MQTISCFVGSSVLKITRDTAWIRSMYGVSHGEIRVRHVNDFLFATTIAYDSHLLVSQTNVDSLTREQLAMVSVLMSRQARRHPDAMTNRSHSLEDVLNAPQIAKHVGLLECARRADGGAAVVVCNSRFLERKKLARRGNGGTGDGTYVVKKYDRDADKICFVFTKSSSHP